MSLNRRRLRSEGWSHEGLDRQTQYTPNGCGGTLERPTSSYATTQRPRSWVNSLERPHTRQRGQRNWDFIKLMENILQELEQGTVLYKVKSATKLLQRQFFLDSKNMNFYYKGSRRKSRDTKVPVSKISEVREGEKDFSKTLHGVQKELCFGVVISGSHKVMYLMASQQELRDRWVRGLRYVMQMDQLAEQRNEVDKRVREVFNMADKNGDNALDFDEIMKLLKILNANIKKKYVQMMFEKADTNKTLGRGHKPVLDRDEFVQFYNLLTRRKEIEEIFLRYSRGKGYMTTRDILVFLKEGQKMPDADEEYCRGLVQHCEPPGPCRSRTQLTIVGFQNFLTSEPQQMFKPEHTRVYQDMSRPITHYFIASSHNTYLAEDQLFGPSKVEMYVRALSDSCRCVELDCWDGPDNEPIIYHGYTRTSKILFKNVIHAIKEYAFKTSPYPVILSLENHCSVEQQSVLARHLENILGDLLWVPDAEITTTPSPKDLMNKIVIKGKKLPPAEEGCYGDEVSDEDEAAEAGSPVDGVVNNNNNNNNNNNVINARDRRKSNAQKKILLSPALSRVTTMKSAGFKNVDQAVALDSPFCVISLSESKVEKLISTQALGLNAVTHTKLIRTYPAGSRTDSSNYNPVPMWNHGCQIVALNYQTGTDPMQLNRGRFLDNGSCGYVLKPNFLLAEEMFGIVNGTVVRNTRKTLRLTIISGMQIPKPQASKKGEVIDPYVKVEIHGAPGDNAEYRTKSIQDNGFNPRWYEACEFKVRVPELAIVRFAVIDEDTGFDDFIGYYTLPFNSMQEGYRHIPILDSSGEPFSHTLLFFHVEISSP